MVCYQQLVITYVQYARKRVQSVRCGAFTVMATTSGDGCVYSNKSETSKTPQECNGKEFSVNGSLSNHKNGYTKSATSLNGIGVSSSETLLF